MNKDNVIELLKDAVAIEYKGVVFDDWAVDATGDMKGIWAEMCQCCAEKYKDLLKDELDDAGAMGVCSVKGCGVIGADTDYEKHYYVDFKPELIKPLSLEELLNREGVEILRYAQNGVEKYGDLVDVLSPQECADLFGKPVKDEDKIYMPQIKEGAKVQSSKNVSLDEKINGATAKKVEQEKAGSRTNHEFEL